MKFRINNERLLGTYYFVLLDFWLFWSFVLKRNIYLTPNFLNTSAISIPFIMFKINKFISIFYFYFYNSDSNAFGSIYLVIPLSSRTKLPLSEFIFCSM